MALRTNAIIIKTGRTKHGPGRYQWGQYEYAQAAVGVLYPDGIPPDAAHKRKFKADLVRAVREQLNKDPAYRARGWRPVGRNTVLRAAGLLKR
jgi:hypothetical protein